MNKLFLALALCGFLSSSFAATHFKTEKHIGGHIVKRIISKTPYLPGKGPIQANSRDGYKVEIERMVDGFAGPYVEPEFLPKGLDVEVGIDFQVGVTVIASREVQNDMELALFEKKDFLSCMKPENAKRMALDESYQFTFEGALIADPSIKGVGVWAVASGGWQATITKKEGSKVEVEFALINGQSASFYFDKLQVMLSYDIGREMEKGFAFEMDLSDPQVSEAYSKLFTGNLFYVQKLAKKNKHIVFTKESQSRSAFKGTGVWARSPLVAWFLWNSTRHMVQGEEEEFSIEEKKLEKTISASYEESDSLDFLGSYHGKLREFKISQNEESKEYELTDTWSEENTSGIAFAGLLSNMKEKTQLDEYFNYAVPQNFNVGYNVVNFEVQYSEKVFEHVLSGHVDVEKIREAAMKNLEAFYKVKLTKIPPEMLYTYLEAKNVERSLIEIGLAGLAKKVSKMNENVRTNPSEALRQYALFMKSVYKAPSLYKAWIDYSKRCGLELNVEIGTQHLAKFELHKAFAATSSCKIE